MRSTRPIPGNPWPHDMVITIEDRPNTLLELLWIREAYGLRIEDEDAPPLLVDPPAAADGSLLTVSTRVDWEQRWPLVWRAASTHSGRDRDPAEFERLHETANGSPERLQILQEMFGPTWADEFGDAAFADDSYRDWSLRGADTHLASLDRTLSDSPEHRDLDALVRAWRAGLTKVVTIPCRGEYTRRITDNALLTTDAARAESATYRDALDSFA